MPPYLRPIRLRILIWVRVSCSHSPRTIIRSSCFLGSSCSWDSSKSCSCSARCSNKRQIISSGFNGFAPSIPCHTLTETPSSSSNRSLRPNPPEYPPRPFLANTLWQGTIIEIGLRPLACPTALAESGFPRSAATS